MIKELHMPRLFRSAAIPAAIVISAALLSPTASAQTNGSPERYSATAINMNNGSAGTIDISVDRWSTDKERDALIAVMMEKGPEKLLDALQDARPTGHFGAPGNLSWDLRFARKVALPEGGERIVLVTDRRIGFWEATNQPRAIDYPFTVIELRLNRDGVGEGKMSVATKVIYDKEHNIITLENYGIQPVQLTHVEREQAKH
jgi:hypothetical protein